MDFDAAKSLAKTFTTSLTATAIRLVEHGPLPAMLVCSSRSGIEWSIRGDGVKRLWARSPSPNTYAYDILHDLEDDASGDVDASAWFDHPVAEGSYVHEHSTLSHFSQRAFPSYLPLPTSSSVCRLETPLPRRAHRGTQTVAT
jgi:hypothetical protein